MRDADQADTLPVGHAWLSEDEIGTLHLAPTAKGNVREWLEVAVSRHRTSDTAQAPNPTVTIYHHTGGRYRAWQLSRAEAFDLVALLLRATERAEMQKT